MKVVSGVQSQIELRYETKFNFPRIIKKIRFKLAPDVDHLNVPGTRYEDVFRSIWNLNLPLFGEIGLLGIPCTLEGTTHQEILVDSNVAEVANLELVPKMGDREHSTRT